MPDDSSNIRRATSSSEFKGPSLGTDRSATHGHAAPTPIHHELRTIRNTHIEVNRATVVPPFTQNGTDLRAGISEILMMHALATTTEQLLAEDKRDESGIHPSGLVATIHISLPGTLPRSRSQLQATYRPKQYGDESKPVSIIRYRQPSRLIEAREDDECQSDHG